MEHPSIFKPLVIVTCAAILVTVMHFAAPVLIPIILGAAFATLLTPIYRWLQHRRVPGGLALLLSLGVLVVVAILITLLVGRSFTTLSTTLLTYGDQFNQRLSDLQPKTENSGQTIDFKQLASVVDPATLTGVLSFVVSTIAAVLKKGLLILILTVFIMAEGPLFIERMKRIFGPDHFLPKNVSALAGTMISYMVLRAVVNLATAVVTGLMFWLFGIPYAALWAVLIFFLSFVPYIGALIATVPPLLLAFAENGMGTAVTVGLLSVVINSVTENIVAPMIMSKGLSISPTVVFVSFIFWMFILGGEGAFIAMPLTLALILFLRSFEETKGIAAMLITTSEPAREPDYREKAVSAQI